MENLQILKTDCLVIGSGCAGLNGADTLYNAGMRNILLATEGLTMGTSRNTGSDKQTYYKPALSSDSKDGVLDMAQSYYNGMAMRGDLALIESANALKCFFKLESLGVPFPQNEYGEFVGYQTDHDQNKRATSAGPLTSKFMTEALEKQVLAKQIPVLNHTLIFKLFKQNGKICGALGVNLQTNIFVLIETPAVLLATGGNAYLYQDKVYPHAQTGMSGMAIEIGAKTANLTEWQYGLASVDFRWNVSGTYQQVLPRYVSVDKQGTEREFLLERMPEQEMLKWIFQKGYQWPFDSRKLQGSSKIDCLVHGEIMQGRQVFMDFTRNPTGFSPSALPEEAFTYLKNSNALQETPILRLLAMNKKAVELYQAHGIDLQKQKLRIAVCAQHQNGGLFVDGHYQTTVDGLYAAGEAAGVFGVYRPGGSALNSTQVSSMRAAQHIAETKRSWQGSETALVQEAETFISQIAFSNAENKELTQTMREMQADMSRYAGFLRNETEMQALRRKAEGLLEAYFERIGAVKPKQMFVLLKFRDMLVSMRETLLAMELWCEKIGARGGAVTQNKEKKATEWEQFVLCTEGGKAFLEQPLPIPKSETWFENVYNKQRGEEK